MDRPRDKTYPLVAELVAYGSRMMGNVKWAAVCGGIGAAFAASFRHNDSSLQETPSTLGGVPFLRHVRLVAQPHLQQKLSRTRDDEQGDQSESGICRAGRRRETGERPDLARHLHGLQSRLLDDEACRLEPIANPFGPKVLPMCPATHATGMDLHVVASPPGFESGGNRIYSADQSRMRAGA